MSVPRASEREGARLLGLFLLLAGGPALCGLAWGQPGLRLGLIVQLVLVLCSAVLWAARAIGRSP
jgi:hypothetical protein